MKNASFSVPLQTALIYSVVAGLWIYFSDRILIMAVTDAATLSVLQTYKGLFFVSVTALLLLVILRSKLRSLEQERIARKEAEQKEKEYQFQNIHILESVSDAFVSLDTNWRYTYMNKKAGEIFNRDPASMIGKHIWTEFPEGVGQAFYHAYYRAREEQKFQYIEEYYPPYDRWFENRIFPSEKGLAIFFHDITDRKKAEKKLKENEERLRQLFENSGEAILLTGTEGTILSANPAACRLFGKTEAEICSAGRSGIVDITDPRLPLALEERSRTGFFRGTLSLVKSDGTKFSGQVTTNVFTDSEGNERSSILIREVTDLERMNISLQAAKVEAEKSEQEKSLLLARLREAQQTAKIGSWEWDLTTNAYWWSDELYRIFDVDPHEYTPSVENNAEYIHPEDRMPYHREIRRILDNGGILDFDVRIVSKTGAWKYCNSKGKIAYNVNGKPVRLSGTFMDITERKSVEEALRESELRWQFALEGPGDGVWDWNAITNTVYFSHQWKAMLGYDDNEIGETLDEWEKRLHPDDKEYVYREIRKHFDGETSVYESEHRLLCKDGTYKWILDRGKILSRTEEGKPQRLIGTHKDITERKLAEALLRASEERFRTTLDNMLEGAQILGFDWRYIYLNKAAERHNRRPSAELIGNRYMEKWPGIETTQVFAVLKRCMEERTSQHMENEFLYPDGVKGWFDLSIQPIPEGIFILSVDITERKKAEEALMKSEEKYRSIIEHSPYAIFVNQNSRVTFVNNACVKLFHALKKEDLLGKNPLDLYHPDLHDIIRERIRVLRDRNEPAPMMEQTIVRQDGATVEVETIAVPFKIGDENAIHVLMYDITERKKNEGRIKEQLTELQRWHEATLGREQRIMELKKEVNALMIELGKPVRYTSVSDEGERHG